MLIMGDGTTQSETCGTCVIVVKPHAGIVNAGALPQNHIFAWYPEIWKYWESFVYRQYICERDECWLCLCAALVAQRLRFFAIRRYRECRSPASLRGHRGTVAAALWGYSFQHGSGRWVACVSKMEIHKKLCWIIFFLTFYVYQYIYVSCEI